MTGKGAASVPVVSDQGPEIFFHVGLGKTGTTFLQYRVFPKLRGLYYIQRTRYKNARQIIARGKHRRYLVSREFDQQMEREVTQFATSYPNTTAILVLRRQDSYIASQYRRYVKNGYRGSFQEFFDMENDNGRFKQDHLRFMGLVALLERTFSQAPIVLIYEDLVAEPSGFVKRLASKLEVTVDFDSIDFSKKHTSYAIKQLRAMQVVGRYLNLRKREVFKNEILHFVWRLGLGAVRYSTLYVGGLLPSSWYSSEPLIEGEELKRIREVYAEDWEGCVSYSRKRSST